MSKQIYRGEELAIEYGEGVEEKLATDPEAAAFVRDATSRIRQALEGVDINDQEAVDRVMRSIGLEPADEEDGEQC